MNKYEKTLDWLTWRFIEPMKPIPACIDKNLSYYNWVCPPCGELHVNRTKEKHCSKCGQAIDWSDYEKYLR